MAEPKDNLSPEDIQQIEGLLSALNKNPLTSEELNPMARALRDKLGFTQPMQIEQEEEGYAEDEENNNITEDGTEDPFADNSLDIADDEGGPPPFRNLEADDDIDLDELLNDGPPKAKAPEESEASNDDPFADSPPVSEEPTLDDFDLPSNEPVAEQDLGDDPFADLGGTPSTEDATDGDLDFAPPSEEPEADSSVGADDPFGDFDAPKAEESGDSSAEDPFANLDETLDEPSTQPAFGDDPFSDLGAEPASTSDDPFAEMGTEAPADMGADPFGDLGTPSASDSFGDDPFASMDTPDEPSGFDSPASSDSSFDDLGAGFDEPAQTSPAIEDSGGFDDPFGDLGVGMEPPGLDDDNPASASTFDDFAPSLDDMPVSSMESSSDDFGGSSGLEDDLDSLGKEDEPSEDLDAGLEDEDLAIIQRELVKYPPKLRRTIIDSIVNNRIPVKSQKEIIELIKAQQKPEDIATFLGGLLGEKVELTDTSGKFSADGVPIIASKDAYTREGAVRRRELIRKTIFSSAAAIFLVAAVISIYRYIYIPRMAGAQYDLGLEKIEEYKTETDAQERKKMLTDAENFFNKGEDIDPFNLTYLNKYCDAYTKVGLYDKAFEKCFGRVEPDFGFEPEDKEHKRSWENRKEVPNISFAKKSEWNDAGVERAGKKPLSELSFSLVSQDKVPRKVIKAGAYIASQLKYNIHDVGTYLALGRFHSFNRKDFIESLPGSTKKRYKNDPLAIEYFKRVFTDGGNPDNIEATSGIARIFYNKKEFGTAVKYYNDIIEKYPKDPVGHGGLLSTYIEMWKKDNNPVYVLNHHRQVRNALNMEDELSLPVLAKLASFYIGLDSEDVRIKYNINPEDQVSGMEIDDNVEYLLNIIYGKESGNRFAEGFYQRARFYLKQGEASRALKQLELAATYDARHYLAVLLMAEYYMQVENSIEAGKLLAEAQNRYEKYKGELGEREEDETLLEGKPGRISFDLGKIAFLNAAGINKVDNVRDFPGKKIYPERSIGVLSEEEKTRRNGLYVAQEYFKAALTIEGGIESDPKMQREVNYYLGWIDYNHGEFASALDFWAELPDEDLYNNATLLLGKGNAFYYTRQYNAALGNYLKLKDDYETRELTIGRLEAENSDHQEVYQTLTALYNNIGAVYEKKQDTINALKYYWKAMETARRIGIVSEISTSNKDLVFARARLDREPLLEDWLPPTLDKIADMKK
jgi:tetratricopeptide (TPR) repeat protein